MTDIGYDDRSRAPDPQRPAQHAAPGAMDAIGSAAGDTATEAKQQTREVVGEVKTQARNLAGDAKSRVRDEARDQNDRLAKTIKQFADELDDMVRDRDDSPARGVVTQVSQGGRRVADYLAEHGPDGVLREVQDFARRRPGTFLAVAAAAGFVVGRLGKGVLGAGSSDDSTSASQYSQYSQYPSSTTVTPAMPAQPAMPAEDVVFSAPPTTYSSATAGGYTSAPSARPDDELGGRRP
jgi:ElaB/YqjD/DUF883 family membrane-anchored ribosome-binding protein